MASAFSVGSENHNFHKNSMLKPSFEGVLGVWREINMVEEVRMEAFCLCVFVHVENMFVLYVFYIFYFSSFAYSCRYVCKTSYTLIFTNKLYIVYTRKLCTCYCAGQKADGDFMNCLSLVLSCRTSPWEMCHRRACQT